MLHCYNCGANMPDDMLYCTSCGRKLEVSEQQTQVLSAPVAPTTPYATNPATQPIVTKNKGGALKAIVITLVSLVLIGAVVAVAGVMFWKYNQRRSVTVNANVSNRSVDISNIADVNVNAVAPDANAIIDNAMKQLQKAANDALAAANQAGKDIPTGKKLDGSTTRINFRPGATSATAAGAVAEEATFVLRAKEGQTLSAHITSPGGCIKFEDEDASTSLQMDAGDNYLTVVNSCGKPTSMVLSVSIK
jgi:hypothetical protein